MRVACCVRRWFAVAKLWGCDVCRLLLFTVHCLLFTFLAGCERVPPPAPPTITPLPTVEALVIGVADGAGQLPELMGDFRPNATLSFPQTNDTALFADLDSGQADAILVHHIPDTRDDIWFNPVAVDGIALIVHPDNPIEALTLSEIQALFNGEVSNWGAVSGQPSAVSLVIQERGSGIRTLFERFVMGEKRVSINAQVRPKPTAVIDAVANDVTALGYVSAGALYTDVAVKPLAVNGLAPSPTTLGTQEYALSLPLYWVSTEEPQGELREVLGWLQSVAGQEALGGVFGRIR